MIVDHVFLPAPFYPDQCDAYEKADGLPRRCARRGQEHASCNVTEGHVSEFISAPNATGAAYARCKECLLYLGPQVAGGPPPISPLPYEPIDIPIIISREAAVDETKRAIQMRQEAIAVKIREALEILALKKGIAAVVPRVRRILTEMLALCGESE
jgi:hypothetical protein